MNKNIIKWISTHIDPSLFKSKTVMITGGNSGIGFSLARVCAYLGSRVYILCRNITKGEEAKKAIQREFEGAFIEVLHLDLASAASIEQCFREISKYDVDIFINNAGVFRLPKGSVTKDGLEITMGTNMIGTMHLTDLLIPYFKTLKHNVYVGFTTSLTSKYAKIDYSDFFSSSKFKPLRMYARSKKAINNLYFNYIDELKDSNIILSLSHPGATYTSLIKKAYRVKWFEAIAKTFMKVFFHSPDKACLSCLASINKQKNVIYGPRGLLQISGYPKEIRAFRDTRYKECVLIARNALEVAITEHSPKN